MKSLSDILAELQAVDTTTLDGVVAALAQVQSDLQALIAAPTPSTDPVVEVDLLTASGVKTVFVPQVTQ